MLIWLTHTDTRMDYSNLPDPPAGQLDCPDQPEQPYIPVSYTHLTLPTIYSV